MATSYTLTNTAADIDAAIQAALNTDRAPEVGATNLVNSNQIYTFVTDKEAALLAADAALVAADAALSGRVNALEAFPKAWFVGKSGSVSSSITLSGYSGGGTQDSSVFSVNTTSGVITANAAGTYKINVNGSFSCLISDATSGFSIKVSNTSYDVRIGASYGAYSNQSGEQVYTSGGSVVVTITQPTSFSLTLTETPSSTTLYYNHAGLSIEKLA